jgi:hypothetical protein
MLALQIRACAYVLIRHARSILPSADICPAPSCSCRLIHVITCGHVGAGMPAIMRELEARRLRAGCGCLSSLEHERGQRRPHLLGVIGVSMPQSRMRAWNARTQPSQSQECAHEKSVIYLRQST